MAIAIISVCGQHPFSPPHFNLHRFIPLDVLYLPIKVNQDLVSLSVFFSMPHVFSFNLPFLISIIPIVQSNKPAALLLGITELNSVVIKCSSWCLISFTPVYILLFYLVPATRFYWNDYFKNVLCHFCQRYYFYVDISSCQEEWNGSECYGDSFE